MATVISDLTELACEGAADPLTTAPEVGTHGLTYANALTHTHEELATYELRVTILDSGDPFV